MKEKRKPESWFYIYIDVHKRTFLCISDDGGGQVVSFVHFHVQLCLLYSVIEPITSV